MTANATTCPGCGAPVTGRFCSACGYPLEGAKCSGCGGELVSGAGFCHRCGTPVGAALARARAQAGPRPRGNAPIPWIVGGLAVVAMIVLVAAQSASDPAADSGAVSLSSGAPMVRGHDLSTMTPRERADRLFNRVMSYHERGVTDRVAFFADMGIRAYEMLPSLDA
ncbi:MAG TPA: zinc ribbon domain-containing protein, partial [Gemmatimonadaceae bacterium]|nr:zinc ribbon domain-containing protein [Gemmatimonadaceae bacterium]